LPSVSLPFKKTGRKGGGGKKGKGGGESRLTTVLHSSGGEGKGKKKRGGESEKEFSKRFWPLSKKKKVKEEKKKRGGGKEGEGNTLTELGQPALSSGRRVYSKKKEGKGEKVGLPTFREKKGGRGRRGWGWTKEVLATLSLPFQNPLEKKKRGGGEKEEKKSQERQ